MHLEGEHTVAGERMSLGLGVERGFLFLSPMGRGFHGLNICASKIHMRELHVLTFEDGALGR